MLFDEDAELEGSEFVSDFRAATSGSGAVGGNRSGEAGRGGATVSSTSSTANSRSEPLYLDINCRASAASSSFDRRLQEAGSPFSETYSNLLALAVRQALGSIEITIPATTNTFDVKAFMKNFDGIGSDAGKSRQSVNNVDTLYATFPLFLYLNPELGGLDPGRMKDLGLRG